VYGGHLPPGIARWLDCAVAQHLCFLRPGLVSSRPAAIFAGGQPYSGNAS